MDLELMSRNNNKRATKLAMYFLFLATIAMTTQGCAGLQEFFTRPQVVTGEVETVPVIVKRPVLDTDSNPELDADGNMILRDEVMMVERAKLADAGQSPAEESVAAALPLLGPWGLLGLTVVGMASGWVTRGYREQKLKEAQIT